MTHPTALAAEYRLALLRFYSSRGLRLLPVYEVTSEGRCACGEQACREPNWGKHPRLGAWQHAATTDLQVLERWHAAWPRSNWAWALDEDTYVLDCDPRNGGPRTDHWLSDLRELGLPEPPATLFQVSGSGGLHAAYRAEGAPSRNGSLIRADGTEVPGVNVKGAGGYVLVAPSNHRSGGLYAWLEPWLDPVPWPELAGFLTRRAARATSASSGGSGSLVDPAPGEQFLDKWYREAPQVAHGNQRGWLLSGLGWMRKRGRSDVEMMSLAWATAQRLVVYDPAEPWSERHVADLVRDVGERYEATVDGDTPLPSWRPVVLPGGNNGVEPESEGAQVVQLRPPAQVTVDNRSSDRANAQELAALFGGRLRWSPLDGWLLWCDTHWCVDELRGVHGLVGALADALDERRATDPNGADVLLQRVRRLESTSGLGACLAYAEHLLPAPLTAFDADPWLLNFPNGTLDLRAFTLREHRSGDLLTRCAAVDYVEGATSRLLDDFHDVFIPHLDWQAALYRLLGAGLVAQNQHRLVVVLRGPSTTGKSQLLEGVRRALGSYAGAGTASVFRGNLDDKPRPDILQLLRCRLACLEEAGEGWELHGDRVKALTGGTPVPVRQMHSKDFITRVPDFTPIIATNADPSIKHADSGVRRRIVTVPFERSLTSDQEDVSKRDAFLQSEECLRALVWRLVSGARELYHGGVGVRDLPVEFHLATEATYEGLDDVTEWFRWALGEGKVVQDPAVSVAASATTTQLHRCYVDWVKKHGDAAQRRDQLGIKSFSQRLANLAHLGLEKDRSNGSRWVGLRVQDGTTWTP